MTVKKNTLEVSYISTALLSLYLLLSLVFIGVTTYNDIKLEHGNQMYSAGAQDGYSRAIVEAITKAQECTSFAIFAGDQKTELINVACLQRKEINTEDITNNAELPVEQ